jgi:hypothetical protein
MCNKEITDQIHSGLFPPFLKSLYLDKYGHRIQFSSLYSQGSRKRFCAEVLVIFGIIHLNLVIRVPSGDSQTHGKLLSGTQEFTRTDLKIFKSFHEFVSRQEDGNRCFRKELAIGNSSFNFYITGMWIYKFIPIFSVPNNYNPLFLYMLESSRSRLRNS